MENITLQLTCPKSHRNFIADLTVPEGQSKKVPLLVFLHGFKGFKDWGTYPKVAQAFASAGIAMLKLNFSHNGTSPESPLDFVDLEAFGRNTLSQELLDIDTLFEKLMSREAPLACKQIDWEQIFLCGHSRGGATAILYTALRGKTKIKKLLLWAAMADFSKHFGEKQVAFWQKQGVIFVPNSRTGQEMPLYYSLCQDYFDNQAAFDLLHAAKSIEIPTYIFHGTADQTLPVSMAASLENAFPNNQILLIQDADHNFGGKHPFEQDQLPAHLQLVVEQSIAFLNRPN